MKTNTIYNENCLDTMKRMSDGFVQSIITSPPYFNLRDYGVDGQIGVEDSYLDYLNNLITIFNSCHRVLSNDGVLFVNIGDTYASKKIGGVKTKSLIGIPDRFKILMIDNGWICRSDIIWHKPNAIPSSAKDRFVNDYERVFMFVKQTRYKFNTQYEERKSKISKTTSNRGSTKYRDADQEKSVRQGMNKERGSKLIPKRNKLPNRLDFVAFLRSKTSAKRLFEDSDSDIKLSTIEHWFRRDEAGFSYPKVDDWSKINHLINDSSDKYHAIDLGLTTIEYEYDDIDKNYSKGRIKRSVWSICTKPSKEKHFAVFPESLVLTPLLSSTDVDDIVYDPFMGSGTTAVVSIDNKRRYIGSELSSEYCEVIEDRVNQKKTHQ